MFSELMKKRDKVILIAVGLVFLIGGYLMVSRKNENVLGESIEVGKTEIVVYKSPTCGCCVGYMGFLRKDNYEVIEKETVDMESIKREYGIPLEMQSCHTAVVEGYFVEGHVPLEVVDKLLKEKPDLDGIALPDMPSGSPGMPGVKFEEFVIYGLKDGQVSEYTRI